MLVGSVAVALAAHASSAVVVVRGMHGPSETASLPVVAGVDGSPTSAAAAARPGGDRGRRPATAVPTTGRVVGEVPRRARRAGWCSDRSATPCCTARRARWPSSARTPPRARESGRVGLVEPLVGAARRQRGPTPVRAAFLIRHPSPLVSARPNLRRPTPLIVGSWGHRGHSTHQLGRLVQSVTTPTSSTSGESWKRAPNMHPPCGEFLACASPNPIPRWWGPP